MANLPEDIVDRIRALERQVHRLTTYVNSKPGGMPGAALAAEPSPQAAREDSGDEPPAHEPPEPNATAENS